MTLMRWEPLTELRRLDEYMDRLWNQFFGRPLWGRTFEGGELPFPMDVWQTKDHYVVQATIPGVRPEDLEVTFSGQQLTIRGAVQAQQEVKEDDYLLRERRQGTFLRAITLPEGVDTDKAEASYEHGVLTIRIPKLETVKPKSIKVNTPRTVEGARAG